MEIKNNVESNGYQFYRLKTEWITEGENGALAKVKTEELINATSYTEAEKVAYSIAEDQCRRKYGGINIEITKTKIKDVLLNEILSQDTDLVCGMVGNYFAEDSDSGTGLYAVRVLYIDIDEKTNKEKRTSDTLYVPATSNANATARINKYLKNDMLDYVIRDTKFDKAEAIYWPSAIYQSKVSSSELE